jgi:hypothetical protein
MVIKKIQSKADAHGVALRAVDKAKRELAGDLSAKFSAKDGRAASASHARGDNNHCKGRLS